jgi:hypothetical protein
MYRISFFVPKTGLVTLLWKHPTEGTFTSQVVEQQQCVRHATHGVETHSDISGEMRTLIDSFNGFASIIVIDDFFGYRI